MAHEAQPSLTTVLNFRDVGRSTSAIRTDMLFRSGQIDDASSSDNSVLRNDYGIKTIINLRGMQPWPLTATSGEDIKPLFPDRIAHQNILGLHRHYIDIYGPQFMEHQRGKLSWFQKTSAIARIMMAPEEGINYLTKQISKKAWRNRMDVTTDAIDFSLPQIKAVFQVFADVDAWPVLVLDEYGKGATGLAICLLLLLLGVDAETIQRDYISSDRYLISTREERLKKNRELGMPDEWVDGNPVFVQAVEEHLWFKHGGVEKYLWGIGITAQEIENIRSCLGGKREFSEKKDWLF